MSKPSKVHPSHAAMPERHCCLDIRFGPLLIISIAIFVLIATCAVRSGPRLSLRFCRQSQPKLFQSFFALHTHVPLPRFTFHVLRSSFANSHFSVTFSPQTKDSYAHLRIRLPQMPRDLQFSVQAH